MIHRMMNGVSEAEIQEHTTHSRGQSPNLSLRTRVSMCVRVCEYARVCVLVGGFSSSPYWRKVQ